MTSQGVISSFQRHLNGTASKAEPFHAFLSYRNQLPGEELTPCVGQESIKMDGDLLWLPENRSAVRNVGGVTQRTDEET